MSKLQESREEAIKRLNDSASALEHRNAPPTSEHLAGLAVTNQAYKIIAELIGGVLVGLGLGAVVDWLFKTTPWGLIGGVLMGFALSIWMARRTADRLMAQAKASGIVPQAVPFDDAEED